VFQIPPFAKGGQGGFLCNLLKSPFTKGGNSRYAPCPAFAGMTAGRLIYVWLRNISYFSMLPSIYPV